MSDWQDRLCTNACDESNNGVCEDGGPDADPGPFLVCHNSIVNGVVCQGCDCHNATVLCAFGHDCDD